MNLMIANAGPSIIVARLKRINIFNATYVSQSLLRKRQTGLTCDGILIQLTHIKKEVVVRSSKTIWVALYCNLVSMYLDCG